MIARMLSSLTINIQTKAVNFFLNGQMICILLGNVHEVLVELEGIGGGGNIFLEVSFLAHFHGGE